MTPRYVLSDYVAEALARAAFEKLEDGNYAGRIPSCTGVIAFGASLRECENAVHARGLDSRGSSTEAPAARH